jgi:hypothetical protein
MVIGTNLSYTDLYTGLQKAENVISRHINPIFLTPEEWKRKSGQEDSMIRRVNSQPKIFVIGSDRDLQT